MWYRSTFSFLSFTLAFTAFPLSAQEASLPWGQLLGHGALDEFDALRPLPAKEGQPARFILGDAHGLLHVYEEREGGYEEVWLSEYAEGAIAGIYISDINADGLLEIVVYTDQGRFFYLDIVDYTTLWINPPTEYQNITYLTVANVDDDIQPELIFVGDGRLIIYDGRDQFEEWRSDQKNLKATDIVVGDVDGDGADEIVLNEGYVFDALFHDLEWQAPEPFGERLGLLDIDDDDIPEIIGEFGGRFVRIFDIDLRREKSVKP